MRGGPPASEMYEGLTIPHLNNGLVTKHIHTSMSGAWTDPLVQSGSE